MLRVLFYQYKWLLVFSSVLSSLGAASGLWMLNLITDAIGNMKEADSAIGYPFYVFFGSVVAVIVFGMVSQYVLLRVSSSVVYDIRKTLLQRILATNYQRLEEISGHRILAVMQEDVSNLSEGLLFLPRFVYSLVTVFLCVGYLFYSSFYLSVFVCFAIIFIVLFSLFFMRLAMIHQKVIREYQDEYYYQLQAIANGGKEMKLSLARLKYYYSDVMLPLLEKMLSKTVKSSGLFIYLDGVTNILVYLLIGSIVYGANYFFPSIDIAVVVAFVLIVLYLVEPISDVMDSVHIVNELRVSLDKIATLELAEAEDFKLPILDKSTENLSLSVLGIEALGYEYGQEYSLEKESKDSNAFSVGPISAEFKAGTSTFIVGGNGSGKSTLVKLITGLYCAKEGGVFIDGKRVLDYFEDHSYQQYFSVVFSDFYLYKELLNSKGELAEDSAISPLLNLMQLSNKVLCENGILSSLDLSTGQRKRLALVQAIYDDKPIFIFDEWAAEQDPEFKEYFYEVLIPKFKSLNKIVIVVTHDNEYFSVADHVIYLESGKQGEL